MKISSNICIFTIYTYILVLSEMVVIGSGAYVSKFLNNLEREVGDAESDHWESIMQDAEYDDLSTISETERPDLESYED